MTTQDREGLQRKGLVLDRILDFTITSYVFNVHSRLAMLFSLTYCPYFIMAVVFDSKLSKGSLANQLVLFMYNEAASRS
jgi:hypothetical protein